jgi:hypothetical protein
VPNIKDEQIKQEDLIKNVVDDKYVYDGQKRGKMVGDIEWEEGFFLKTFPDIFICKN